MIRPASVDELFAIAIAMEDLSQEFYLALAPACDNREVSRLCRVLAGQEAQHRQLFETMRHFAAGAPSTLAAPGALLDMEALEDVIHHQVLPLPEDVRKVALEGGLSNALDLAIRLEEDAIAFYGRIARVMPALGDEIDALVHAERDHLRQLRDAKHRLSDSSLRA